MGEEIKLTFNHKIIDADDLAKILMEWNYYPAIFAAAIDACPALDLFEEEEKKKGGDINGCKI